MVIFSLNSIDYFMIFRSFSNMKKQDDSVQTDQKNSEKCTVSH